MKELLNIKDIEAITGFKKTKIYDAARNGHMPAPVKIGNTSRWKRSDINAWLNSLSA